MSALELLQSCALAHETPALRIIFTWMQSTARTWPAAGFASRWGGEELDVRYVSPSFAGRVGELLSGEDPSVLNAELERTAREAVPEGIRLSAFPEFDPRRTCRATRPARATAPGRLRAGSTRPSTCAYALNQRLHGCAYPGRDYVIRPNGAVSPCIYWQEAPIGFYPAQASRDLRGDALARIRSGLRSGAGRDVRELRRAAHALYRFRNHLTAAPASLPTRQSDLPVAPGDAGRGRKIASGSLNANVLSETAQRLLIEERDLLARLEAALSRFGAARPTGGARRARRQLDELFLLVVVGEYNSGKSAFLNALLGGRFLAEGATPTTDQIHIVAYGPEKTVEQIRPSLRRLTFPVPWLQEINVVDTPGTNSVIREHQEITEAFVPRADLVLFVTSADRPFSESERQFLTGVRAWGKKIVIVINKIDILEDAGAVGEVTDFVRQQATNLLGMSPVLFPSPSAGPSRPRRGSNEARKCCRRPDSSTREIIVETLDENERSP